MIYERDIEQKSIQILVSEKNLINGNLVVSPEEIAFQKYIKKKRKEGEKSIKLGNETYTLVFTGKVKGSEDFSIVYFKKTLESHFKEKRK
jgi:hypothetical protein